MSIHEAAKAAGEAIYDAEFARLNALITDLNEQLVAALADVAGNEDEVEALKASITVLTRERDDARWERDNYLAQRDSARAQHQLALAEVARLQAIIDAGEQPEEPEEPEIPVPTGAVFGPTGKNWPSRTPRLGEAELVLISSPTASAIASAINQANTAANVGKKAVIYLTPGDITGLGGGATSTPVLQNIGVANRAGGRILITPRDGAGTVGITGSSARFYKVRGVSFIGINAWKWGQAQAESKGVLFSGVEDFAWGRSKARYANFTNNDLESKNVELVEVVAPESFLWPDPTLGPSNAADRWQWKNGSTPVGTSTVSVIASYLAPNRTQNGDAAHLDMWQIFNAGRWIVTVRDTVGFSATNQGVIVTNETEFDFDHCLIVGGDAVKERYKLEPNAEDAVNDGAPWPLNGTPVRSSAKNGTIIVGTVKGWSSLQYDATSGRRAFMSKAEIDAVSPIPTDAYLQSIWS